MRALYYLRVFFLSFEFACSFFGIALIILFGPSLRGSYADLQLNSEAIKWLMLFPVGIAAWTLKEGVRVLFPDGKHAKVLHEWPDYWRLKAHFNIGVLNSIAYSIPCILVWIVSPSIGFTGAWVFLTCTIALSINAFSFYGASIAVRTALLRVQDVTNSLKNDAASGAS